MSGIADGVTISGITIDDIPTDTTILVEIGYEGERDNVPNVCFRIDADAWSVGIASAEWGELGFGGIFPVTLTVTGLHVGVQYTISARNAPSTPTTFSWEGPATYDYDSAPYQPLPMLVALLYTAGKAVQDVSGRAVAITEQDWFYSTAEGDGCTVLIPVPSTLGFEREGWLLTPTGPLPYVGIYPGGFIVLRSNLQPWSFIAANSYLAQAVIS